MMVRMKSLFLEDYYPIPISPHLFLETSCVDFLQYRNLHLTYSNLYQFPPERGMNGILCFPDPTLR